MHWDTFLSSLVSQLFLVSSTTHWNDNTEAPLICEMYFCSRITMKVMCLPGHCVQSMWDITAALRQSGSRVCEGSRSSTTSLIRSCFPNYLPFNQTLQTHFPASWRLWCNPSQVLFNTAIGYYPWTDLTVIFASLDW